MGTHPKHFHLPESRHFACSPEKCCEYFFRICLGKMAGIFGNFFLVSVSPKTKHEKLLEKIGENSEQNSGQNSGRKFKKFGELSFCDFCDLQSRSYGRKVGDTAGQTPRIRTESPRKGPRIMSGKDPLDCSSMC